MDVVSEPHFELYFNKIQLWADPGFFLGGGAPLIDDVTDGKVKKFNSEYVYTKTKASSQGKGSAPLHPPPGSTPATFCKVLQTLSKFHFKILITIKEMLFSCLFSINKVALRFSICSWLFSLIK